MSRHCLSCGSIIGAGESQCPVCGEQLEGSQIEETQPATSPIPDSSAQSEAAPLPPAIAQSTGNIVCAECGAHNSAGASYCSACGSNLLAQEEKPAGAVHRKPSRSHSSPARDYLLATVAAVVIGGIALLVSTPEEKTGPPMPDQQHQQGAAGQGATGQGGAMPPGHPPTEERKLTPEQEKQLAELERQVAASPDDLEAALKLANLYYDVDRHNEALPLYRRYHAKHPENLDVWTDMAFSLASSVSLDSGITELHKVIAKNPNFQNAPYNLAMMHLAKRNRDSTLVWLQRVVAIDSTTRPGQFASQILQDINKGGLEGGTAPGATPP